MNRTPVKASEKTYTFTVPLFVSLFFFLFKSLLQLLCLSYNMDQHFYPKDYARVTVSFEERGWGSAKQEKRNSISLEDTESR